MNRDTIHRIFDAEATDKEIKEVQEWVGENDRNMEIFVKERRLYDCLNISTNTFGKTARANHLIRTKMLYAMCAVAAISAVVFFSAKTLFVSMRPSNELVQTIFPNLYIRLFYSKKGIEFFYSTSGVTDEDMDKESMLPIKQASGFEKAILSICFKSVLCEAYNIPFVILDEVDAAASEENSRRFFDIVINGGLFQQSIIISHKIDIQDTIKGMSDSISAYMVADGDFEHA